MEVGIQALIEVRALSFTICVTWMSYLNSLKLVFNLSTCIPYRVIVRIKNIILDNNYFLCTRHHSKIFMNINTFNPHNNLMK